MDVRVACARARRTTEAIERAGLADDPRTLAGALPAEHRRVCGARRRPACGIGLRGLGDVLGLQGRLSEAEATYLRSIEHSRVIGDRATTSVSQVHLAMLAEFPAHSSQMRATIHVLATDARRQREVGARVRAEVSEAGIAQARSEAAALALPAVVAEILVAAV